MSLDLGSTALQIDRMAVGLRARISGQRLRLQTAFDALDAFDIAKYEGKRQLSEATVAWNLPAALDTPTASYAPPILPKDFSVLAVDGSHIDADRHIAARCFLINIGVALLTYGSRPDAQLESRGRLYAADDELVIRDESAPFRETAVEGAVLGAKRTAEEAMALAQAAREAPADLPTLALMDGSLIMLGLVGRGYDDYIRRELVSEGFVRALEELRGLAAQRTLAVASYISMPRSAEVVNGLRLEVCPYEIAECGRYCGEVAPGHRPCDAAAAGLLDRDLFAKILEPGERSGVFATSSPMVSNYYQGHEVHFFYVHAGEEIGRVEIPSWVAEDGERLGLTHSLVIDQCRRGPGYPTALMEAHEQAVISGADRSFFVQQVESALHDQALPVYSSEKSRSKRLRWL